MNSNAGLPVFLGFIGVAVLARLIADRLDRQRIRDSLGARGCRTLEIHWDPFGPGWFGEKSDRLYEVVYAPPSGGRVVAHCKTSLFSGVYWHDSAGPASASQAAAERDPLVCLACGKSMGGKSKCPECGWTYKGEA